MHHRVTRLVLPMAAVAVVTAAGSAAGAGAAPAAPRTTPCPADVRAPVSVIPGASPSAGEYAPSLRLALTARGTRAAGSDLVEYRVTARPARTPLRDVTVTARLTCVPGDALLAGRPSVSTGRATAGPRAVTWRFDLGNALATETFAVRVRPNARGGPLVGEIATTGPVSNCPALRAADTPIDAYCRVTVLVPGLVPSRASGQNARAPRPAAPPAARPAPVPAATLAVHPAVPPIVSPTAPGLPVAPPAAPPAPGAGALPVVPQTGPVPGGGPSPSPSVLSQLDRAPIVPAGSSAPDAAGQAADPPGTVMRPADSRGDLGGRALAFLIGGVAFLLIAVAVASSLIGARLRRLQEEDEDETGLDIRPRPPALPRPPTLDGDLPRPTPPDPPRTIVDVVRRTAEAGEPRPYTDQAAGRERPAGRIVVDE